jgi:signal transduction histidine kinase
VAAIRSTAEVTLASPRPSEEYERVLEEMIEECARLESLVSQLLLLSESDADRLKVHEQQLDLSQIVERAVAMFGPAAESLDIRVNSTCMPAIIHGNPHHLQQPVSNLLDNALKFTPPQGRIGVTVEIDEVKKQAVLSVSDSGSGILPDDVPRVFERFYRGEQARYDDGGHRGAGLGLSICKSIVGAHFGTIAVFSTPHVGTTFTVRLPLATTSETREATDSAVSD